VRRTRSTLWALLLALFAGAAGAADDIYAGLAGELMLENPRVRVVRFVLPPGSSTGRHHGNAAQLLVFVKGGLLRGADGRVTLWRDGRVLWQDPASGDDPGSENVGREDIVLLWVSVRPAPRGAAVPRPGDFHLSYPNIPGEDLLENARVLVQRFTVQPGQWEGVHAHRPNMLYIHIRGGQWAERSYHAAAHPYAEASADGSVGWMRTVDISEGHESGNIGRTPIDPLWVTLKD
jgi:quercetin dioxygenase-like cupin family protein